MLHVTFAMFVCQQADIQGQLKGERGEKVSAFSVHVDTENLFIYFLQNQVCSFDLLKYPK